MSDSSLKIGELAKMTGAQVETVRYYEREGLLPAPHRSEGNYRLYDLTHVEHLQFVLRCRSLDMTLNEIRDLLKFRASPEQNCGAVNVLLDQHIEHVTTRIAELQSLENQLKKLRKLCVQSQKAKDCQILQGLSKPQSATAKKLATHGGGCHSKVRYLV